MIGSNHNLVALFIYKHWKLTHNANNVISFPTSFVYIVYVFKSIYSFFYKVKVNICIKTCKLSCFCPILIKYGSRYLLDCVLLQISEYWTYRMQTKWAFSLLSKTPFFLFFIWLFPPFSQSIRIEEVFYKNVLKETFIVTTFLYQFF